MGKYKIKIGIIGGSGLDDPANDFFKSGAVFDQKFTENEFGLPSGDLCQGTISGVDVVLLSRHGCGHKITPTTVNYRANIEALRLVGCTHILATTACGSLVESIGRGQLAILNSFIDRTVHRKNTFYDGTSERYAGVCHIPCEPAFDTRTAQFFVKAADELNIPVQNGATVVTIEGPRFSSKAESKMFRLWGGHLINMTTCPEVYLAKEAGLLYAAVATATDYDCWKECNDIVCATDVITEFKKNVSKVTRLVVKTVELIGKEDWDQQIDDLKAVLKANNVSR